MWYWSKDRHLEQNIWQEKGLQVCRAMGLTKKSIGSHVLLKKPCQNGVGLVCVNSTTFIFNYCKVIDCPNVCIANVQATTTTSFSFVNTPCFPTFLDLVFPFKWFERLVSIYTMILLPPLMNLFRSL